MAECAVNPERLLALLREMVNIYSPSGKEHELVEFLEAYLRPTRLEVELREVGDGRANLEVHSGGGEMRTLFLGHVDTVPAYDIERYELSERDGVYAGLGTADMKGGCAAMLEAFVSCAERGMLPEGVMLALVVGEEETGDGTRALLQEHSFDQALVAEPTDLHPCLEHYGYVEMIVRAFGYRRHAAMSGRDTNAIRSLLPLLLRLEERIEEREPGTVLNIRDLHSSESGFAVPDRCVASLDLHIPPDRDAAAFASSLRSFADTHLQDSHLTRHEVVFDTLASGFRTGEDGPLARTVKSVCGRCEIPWEPRAFTSHSDANLLHDTGCATLMLGPGQLAKAHTRDESVEPAQVVQASDLFARTLQVLARSEEATSV